MNQFGSTNNTPSNVLRAAAIAGNPDAAYQLYHFYHIGENERRDPRLARRWLSLACRLGSVDARIVSILRNGSKIVRHSEGAPDEVFAKLKSLNHPKADYSIAVLAEDGVILRCDKKKAFTHYRRAALLGLPDAYYDVGRCYCNGIGVRRSYSKAAKWFRKGEQLGSDDCKYMTAVLDIRQRVRTRGAVRRYTALASRGYSQAAIRLGEMYYQGVGVRRDVQRALYWYRNAARNKFTEGQYRIGLMYWAGQGVKRNHRRAVYWLSKASHNEHINATIDLGYCVLNGIGTRRNVDLAQKLFSRAAASGATLGWANLATILLDVGPEWGSIRRVTRWLRRSAESGDVVAMQHLAKIYLRTHRPASIRRAVELLDEAARKGDKKSRLLLANLRSGGGGIDSVTSFDLHQIGERVCFPPQGLPL